MRNALPTRDAPATCWQLSVPPGRKPLGKQDGMHVHFPLPPTPRSCPLQTHKSVVADSGLDNADWMYFSLFPECVSECTSVPRVC